MKRHITGNEFEEVCPNIVLTLTMPCYDSSDSK